MALTARAPTSQVRSDLSSTTLRVAVIVGGASVPRWVAQLLDRIDACSYARVVGLVRTARAVPDPRPSLLYGLYRRLDRRRFAAAADPLDEVDLRARAGLRVQR